MNKNKKRNLWKKISAGVIMCCTLFCSVTAYAGDINAAEQRIIAFYNRTFYYDGKLYVATDAAKSVAYARLIADGVDLTDSEATNAIRQASKNIAEGIANGILVEYVEKEPENNDNSGSENNGGSDNSGNNSGNNDGSNNTGNTNNNSGNEGNNSSGSGSDNSINNSGSENNSGSNNAGSDNSGNNGGSNNTGNTNNNSGNEGNSSTGSGSDNGINNSGSENNSGSNNAGSDNSGNNVGSNNTGNTNNDGSNNAGNTNNNENEGAGDGNSTGTGDDIDKNNTGNNIVDGSGITNGTGSYIDESGNNTGTSNHTNKTPSVKVPEKIEIDHTEIYVQSQDVIQSDSKDVQEVLQKLPIGASVITQNYVDSKIEARVGEDVVLESTLPIKNTGYDTINFKYLLIGVSVLLITTMSAAFYEIYFARKYEKKA